ncbi:MAG: InlB B-repeat-containing protein, partial [Bryobacteraceae bacterium]
VPTLDPASPHNIFPIPGHFDFAPRSKHVLGAPSPQTDRNGDVWVFDSWSNGGRQDMLYTTGEDTNVPETLTARFVRAKTISFLTVPAGLKLEVDGRGDWPSYHFIWPVGSKYTVSAPAEQTGVQGRKYFFKRWSNDGPATQEIAVTGDMAANGYRLTAHYEALNRVVFETSPSRVPVKVDGVDCQTPCNIDRAAGTQVRLAAPATVSQTDASRYEFIGWGDTNETERTITLDKDTEYFKASYRVFNRLTTVVDPAEGAEVHVEPASPDGFYPEDSQITLTAKAKKGFRFRRWDGDLSGTSNSGVLNMSVSRTARVMLERVPYIEPAGVRNAAGETPEPGVAPGSIISIFGASMALQTEAGPVSPLAQTLAGVTVHLGDRLLPLIYVSPEQINAQLPSDVPVGTHSLTVRSSGFPDVEATVEIVRNAPGLFESMNGDKRYAIAFHEDGSQVTPESPARRDEQITLLGTGFGRLAHPPVDGFAVPASPPNALVDAAEIVSGDTRLKPAWCGAAPGFVGISAAKFKLGSEVSPSSDLLVSVVVNGRSSNPVHLPVE